jgi:gas vesicle protein
MSNIASNTVSLLGGAALGAVAAYVLDPDQGQSRRREISSRAGDLGQYAQSIADQVKSHAVDVAKHPQAIVDQAHQELHSSIQSLVDRAKDYAGNLSDRGRSTASDLSDRAKKSLQRQTGLEVEHHSNAGLTAGTIGALAIGAGVMFFLDPARGHGRRAWAEDKISSWARRGTKSATRYSRHVGNQAKGVAHEAKKSIPAEWNKAAERATDAVANVVHKASDKIKTPS